MTTSKRQQYGNTYDFPSSVGEPNMDRHSDVEPKGLEPVALSLQKMVAMLGRSMMRSLKSVHMGSLVKSSYLWISCVCFKQPNISQVDGHMYFNRSICSYIIWSVFLSLHYYLYKYLYLLEEDCLYSQGDLLGWKRNLLRCPGRVIPMPD